MSAAANHQQKLDAIISELAKLRLTRERADAVFLLRLREVENEHMPLLRQNGHESFERFLKSSKLCDPARYRDFVAGLNKLGEEQALALGADAIVEAASLTSKAAGSKYVTAIEAWREQHRGVAPTRETSAKILRQVDPREEEPKAIGNARRQDDLRIRCAELEQLVAQQRAELMKLRKERDELKARCVQLSKERGKK